MLSNVVLHSLPAGYRFDLRGAIASRVPPLRIVASGEAASS